MTTQTKCTNCGAPISDRAEAACRFCGYLLEGGGHSPRTVTTTRSSVAPQRAKPWTEAEILDQLGADSARARDQGTQILEWAHQRNDLSVVGNTGLTYSKVAIRLTKTSRGDVTVVSLCGAAKDFLEIPFGTLTSLAPFPDPAERRRLHEALVPLTRMAKGDPARDTWAYADLQHIRSREDGQRLIDVLDDAINRIRAAEA